MTAPKTPPTAERVIHFKDMQQLLDRAHDYGQTVRVRAYEAQTGNIVTYDGWLVSSSSWRKGWHRLVSPTSRQIRTVPDIFIIEVNSLPVYL